MSTSLVPDQVVEAIIRIFDEKGDCMDFPGRKFQIIKQIGSGGMAKVYLASQMGTAVDCPDHFVAIKLFNGERFGIDANEPDGDLNDPDLDPEERQRLSKQLRTKRVIRDRFRQEFQIQSSIFNHPHIARVIGWGETEDGMFCVAEFIEGHGVDELILDACKQGRLITAREDEDVRLHFMDERNGLILDRPLLGWKTVFQISLALADALREIHAHSIVHRDVKPSNIMCRVDGSEITAVKVLDFGISKVMDTEMRKAFGVNSTLTELGSILGTPVYAAPELIIRSDSVSPRVDVFAAGITVFELITGCRPRMTGQSDLYRRAIGELEIFDIAEYVADVPEPLRQVILKATQKDPELRHADGNELYWALVEAQAGRVPDLAFQKTIYAPPFEPIAPSEPEVTEQIQSRDMVVVSRPSIVEIVTVGAKSAFGIGARLVLISFVAALLVGFVYSMRRATSGDGRFLEGMKEDIISLAPSIRGMSKDVPESTSRVEAVVSSPPEPVAIKDGMNESQEARYTAGMNLSRNNPRKALPILLELEKEGVGNDKVLALIKQVYLKTGNRKKAREYEQKLTSLK